MFQVYRAIFYINFFCYVFISDTLYFLYIHMYIRVHLYKLCNILNITIKN